VVTGRPDPVPWLGNCTFPCKIHAWGRAQARDPSTIGDRLRPVTIEAYPCTGQDSLVNACPA